MESKALWEQFGYVERKSLNNIKLLKVLQLCENVQANTGEQRKYHNLVYKSLLSTLILYTFSRVVT